MPAVRFIEYEGRAWRLSELAATHHLSPGTLSHRIARLGDTTTGIARALATGIMTRSQAGMRGATNSPWRHPGAR